MSDTPDNLCAVGDVERALMGVPLNVYKDFLATQSTSFEAMFNESWYPEAEAFVQTYTHFTWKAVTETRWYQGNMKSQLPLGVYPIRSVSNCCIHLLPQTIWYKFHEAANINTVDSRGVQIAEPYSKAPDYEAADLWVDCRDGILEIPPTIKYLQMQNYLPGWNYLWLYVTDTENIEITMEYGYDDTSRPEAIKRSCANLCALMVLASLDSVLTGGQSSWAIGDERRTWGRGARTTGRTPDEFAAFSYEGMYSTLAHRLLGYVTANLPKFRRMQFI
jgi:hypothetical protein